MYIIPVKTEAARFSDLLAKITRLNGVTFRKTPILIVIDVCKIKLTAATKHSATTYGRPAASFPHVIM
jgi:hypothetical protein